MTGSTRVPPAEISGVRGALVKRFTRRMLGEVPEPLGVMWHNRPVLDASLGLSRRAQKWNACDQDLKSYAHLAAVALVGCSFCLDLGYFRAGHEGLDVRKAREVPRWREASVFTPLERRVMEYAEAMCQTPLTVTDEMSAALLKDLGATALLELTSRIGVMNMTARGNVALGIRSAEFSASCGLPPLAARAADVTPA